jgi:hypothetical protein
MAGTQAPPLGRPPARSRASGTNLVKTPRAAACGSDLRRAAQRTCWRATSCRLRTARPAIRSARERARRQPSQRRCGGRGRAGHALGRCSHPHARVPRERGCLDRSRRSRQRAGHENAISGAAPRTRCADETQGRMGCATGLRQCRRGRRRLCRDIRGCPRATRHATCMGGSRGSSDASRVYRLGLTGFVPVRGSTSESWDVRSAGRVDTGSRCVTLGVGMLDG